MLTTIRLYGKMGKMFGRVHRVHLDTNSSSEAFRYLCSQFPAARAYMVGAKDSGVGFAIFRGKENIVEAQLNDPVGSDEIRVAPVVIGSKSGGVFNIILGAVIIAASFVADYFTGGAFGKATNYSTYIMGASMILGGVVQLLSPVPHGTKNKSVDNEPSYAFNGAVNTQAQGNPVPLLYGRMIVGSAVISAGINAEDYAPISSGIGSGAVLGNTPMNGPYDVRRTLGFIIAQ